jgi:predicted membrane-bound spermidine synthase
MTTSFPPFKRAALYATVFCTGAAVMIIELSGTRLIAPFYGASLYVWSSLIPENPNITGTWSSIF